MSQCKNYLESTTPGMTWSLSVFKPDGRPAYAYAVEGKLTIEPGRLHSFETIFGGPETSRQVRVMLPGNNTLKNRAEAMTALLGKLSAAEFITPGQTIKLD